MKKFYVLRVKDKDLWFAHKGNAGFTSSSRNIHIFAEESLQSRLEHTERVKKHYGFEVVSEDWGYRGNDLGYPDENYPRGRS